MKRVCGFSLIELLIVATVLGILAAIAYPQYLRYTYRAYRANAASCLVQQAAFLERFYVSGRTYSGAALPECAGDTFGRYQFASALQQSSYTLSATPINDQLNDPDCACTLTYNETKVKGVTGGNCNVVECWGE